MWISKKLSQNSSKGFTLLEVMIAIAILVIALGSIFAIQGNSISATDNAKRLTTVAMLAKNQMIETELLIEGKKFNEVREEESGKFDTPFEEYSWKREIKEIEFPDLSAIGTNPQDESSTGGQTQTASMVSKIITKFLSSALREVNVEIFWKEGKKEKSFSVSTYWVDLNYDLEISP